MTTEEQPERTQHDSERTKRRTDNLFGLGLTLFVGGMLLYWAVWKEMEPSSYDSQPERAKASVMQQNTATNAMLVPATAGVLCFVLAYVPFRARLMAVGILLLGLTAVYVAFLLAKKEVGRVEAAMYYGFMITVTGLSGLVCAVLGMVRLLPPRKGT